MGSPEIAAAVLEAVAAAADVVCVVTQPDKPKGRGQELAAPAVKEVALRLGLPVLQPKKVRVPEFEAELRSFRPDVLLVIAYGRILPPNILTVAPHGALNVHASLLPKYRGAAPINWAIIKGEHETGVTIMQMEEGLDTGPMLLKRTVPISEEDTAGSLYAKLTPVGAAAAVEALDLLAAGRLVPERQDDAQATFAPVMDKSHGKVDFTKSAHEVRDLVRGVDPWPGAFAVLGADPLKLYGARLAAGSGPPGSVLGADASGLIVACGQGAVAFAELQLPGRKRLAAKALLAGRAIPPGTVLTGPPGGGSPGSRGAPGGGSPGSRGAPGGGSPGSRGAPGGGSR
jgi:methionyl-tRNA formyltransferase